MTLPNCFHNHAVLLKTFAFQVLCTKPTPGHVTKADARCSLKQVHMFSILVWNHLDELNILITMCIGKSSVVSFELTCNKSRAQKSSNPGLSNFGLSELVYALKISDGVFQSFLQTVQLICFSASNTSRKIYLRSLDAAPLAMLNLTLHMILSLYYCQVNPSS